MLFSPLRDNGRIGSYLRFEASFTFRLYKILFLESFSGDIQITDLPATMPSTESASSVATPMPETTSAQAQTQSNGTSKQSRDPPAIPAASESSQSSGHGKSVANSQASAPAKQLTPAELKKKAKEEKAARRAQAVAAKEAESTPAATETSQPGPSTTVLPPAPSHQNPQQRGEVQKGTKTQQKTAGPAYGASRNVPVRSSQKAVAAPVAPKKEDKTVEFFRHLYKPRTTSIAGVSKEVHPAFLALGLQMANYTICGSCARLVAMLQAIKRVSSCQGKSFYTC